MKRENLIKICMKWIMECGVGKEHLCILYNYGNLG